MLIPLIIVEKFWYVLIILCPGKGAILKGELKQEIWYIFNYSKIFRKKTISVEELWNTFKDTKEFLNKKILNKKELFNIITKFEEEGKIQTSINII